MTGNMSGRAPMGWQLVLADLSLILFLTTASALSDKHQTSSADAAMRSEEMPDGSAAASLYLAATNAPSFSDWLAAQPRDPREQLTIRADYQASDQRRMLEQVQLLSRKAIGAGFTPRIIVEPAAETRISASFAFDAGPAFAQNMARLLQDGGGDTIVSGE